VLENEGEHVRAGDPRLLAAAIVCAVLTPWNPAAWWQLRRLRLAIEVDCDARVLRRRGDVRAYGSVLLEVGRRTVRTRVAVAGFAEPVSALERRIRIMTAPRVRRPLLRVAACGAITAAFAGAACGALQPTLRSSWFWSWIRYVHVYREAMLHHYPPLMRDAGTSARVSVCFTVGADGSARVVRVFAKPGVDPAFAQAGRAMVDDFTFPPTRPGEVLGMEIAFAPERTPTRSATGNATTANCYRDLGLVGPRWSLQDAGRPSPRTQRSLRAWAGMTRPPRAPATDSAATARTVAAAVARYFPDVATKGMASDEILRFVVSSDGEVLRHEWVRGTPDGDLPSWDDLPGEFRGILGEFREITARSRLVRFRAGEVGPTAARVAWTQLAWVRGPPRPPPSTAAARRRDHRPGVGEVHRRAGREGARRGGARCRCPAVCAGGAGGGGGPHLPAGCGPRGGDADRLHPERTSPPATH
jgi:hypothetical protein